MVDRASGAVEQLTVGSLFAGIGGLDLGLERAGMEVRWQVEIDDYCRRVLAKHWPDVGRFVDVGDVGAESLETVDVVCGGFPCQGVSKAGKREGMEDERSGLWSEMWRIVRELRPRYVLVENVPGLRSRGLGTVLGDLAEIGYDAEWDCLPAAAFGAPHRRDRIFLVAYPGGGGRQGWDGEQKRELGSEESPDLGANGAEGPVADPVRRGLTHRGTEPEHGNAWSTGQANRGQWEAEPDVGRVADGVPDRVDRIRALGNAVVPQVAEWIGRRIVEHAVETGYVEAA